MWYFPVVAKDGSGFLDETEIREVLVTLRKDAGGKEPTQRHGWGWEALGR